jgi:hypothetical protein
MSFNPTFSLNYMSWNWAGNVPRYAVVALVEDAVLAPEVLAQTT